jgi:hypothetical protein
MTYQWAIYRNGLLMIRKLTKAGAMKVAEKYVGSIVVYEVFQS